MIHAPLEQAGGYQGLLQERQVYPPVAKLDIAADSDSEGRGFESLRAGHQAEPGRNSRSGLSFYFAFLLASIVGIFFVAQTRKRNIKRYVP